MKGQCHGKGLVVGARDTCDCHNRRLKPGGYHMCRTAGARFEKVFEIEARI
jgi:hypothetical protein